VDEENICMDEPEKGRETIPPTNITAMDFSVHPWMFNAAMSDLSCPLITITIGNQKNA
jgi:hypothetical protein